MSSERLERVLADAYATGLDDLSLDEVRARRHECQEIEVGLSYARRLVQGRLDIIHAELERRQAGGGRSDVGQLVDRLKEGEMLGDQARPAGFGRLPTLMAPDQASDEFSVEIDEIADLTALETRVSNHRRTLFERIDALQAELVRRYRTGEASVDSLLT